MLTRWLLIVLLVSVGALLIAAGAGARHVWRQRHRLSSVSEASVGDAGESEIGPDVGTGDE